MFCFILSAKGTFELTIQKKLLKREMSSSALFTTNKILWTSVFINAILLCVLFAVTYQRDSVESKITSLSSQKSHYQHEADKLMKTVHCKRNWTREIPNDQRTKVDIVIAIKSSATSNRRNHVRDTLGKWLNENTKQDSVRYFFTLSNADKTKEVQEERETYSDIVYFDNLPEEYRLL